MNGNSKIALIFLLLLSSFGYCQTTITVKFIGNEGLHLTDGTTHLYVDFPYKSGAHHYMEYDERELDSIPENAILLFTHRHSDHYSKKLVNKVKKAKHITVYGNWNTKELMALNNSIKELSIEPIKTRHKFTFNHYSYLITWHNKKIYISGDTGDYEEVSSITKIDWAFVNPWLYMNALEDKITINATNFGMYHLYPNQKLPETKPDNLIFLKEQYQYITIPITK